MALGLADLQQSGITVLFRPFHEMNGDWFFWGTQVKRKFF
jgi:mannan endo-1,4-beta-mannosidase